jgi:hypothetical protein
MAIMHYTKAEDILDAEGMPDREQPVDLSPLLGTWVNTNPLARGIAKVILSDPAGAFTVHAFGAGDAELYDWQEVKGAVYTDGVGKREATSFTALYEAGFMDVQLQTYLAKGVLVIASFTQFKDGSGRANTFVKEFFYRQ